MDNESQKQVTNKPQKPKAIEVESKINNTIENKVKRSDKTINKKNESGTSLKKEDVQDIKTNKTSLEKKANPISKEATPLPISVIDEPIIAPEVKKTSFVRNIIPYIKSTIISKKSDKETTSPSIELAQKYMDEREPEKVEKSKKIKNISKKFKVSDKDIPPNIDLELLDKEEAKALIRKFKQKRKTVRFEVDTKIGLNQSQIAQRVKENFVNFSNTKTTKSYFSIFAQNIFTFFNMLCILIAAALIYVGSYKDVFFFFITLLNMTIGIIQEIKAKKTVEKLSLLSSPMANVIRDGEQLEIPVNEVVLDDIMSLTIGKQIITDSIVLEGSIEVNESLLTGESVPVKKDIGDLLYAGSFVSAGNCIVKAERVGEDNYISELASKAKKYKKPNSELFRSMSVIIRTIGIFIVPLAVILFYKGMSNTGDIQGTISSTAGAMVGMIPAGMFLLTSLALAVGVVRLAKNHTLVQDLYSLEMLARVNVLCLDKTGTITDGRMKVNDCMLLNNSTDYTINEIVGSMLSALKDNNQTAIALYNHFGHNSVLKPTTILPFSSKRKLSAVTFLNAGTYALGAPEFVLSNVSDKLERTINQYAAMGLRVLVIGYSSYAINNDKIPANLKPIAIITIADNIRDTAIQTIKWFKDNDVAVKVISGDNPVTVAEVARRVGIDNAHNYISLEGLNDKEVANIANKYTVFGRVSPEQKSILVKSMKNHGSTVAMTGDGVNDILALKEADCSIVMASGSEAARNVAHLVLMDSNFASMPKVVLEGRRVINNIQRSSSLFLMKTIFTIMLTIFAIAFIPSGYPFTPSQMLLMEFCIIGAPSFFLALQANSNRVAGKFINFVLSRSFPAALVMFCNILVLFLLNSLMEFNIEEYQTLQILSVTLSGLIILSRICSPYNIYRSVLITIISILTLAAIAILPSIAPEFLGITKLSTTNFLLLIVILQFNVPIYKFFTNILLPPAPQKPLIVPGTSSVKPNIY